MPCFWALLSATTTRAGCPTISLLHPTVPASASTRLASVVVFSSFIVHLLLFRPFGFSVRDRRRRAKHEARRDSRTPHRCSVDDSHLLEDACLRTSPRAPAA